MNDLLPAKLRESVSIRFDVEAQLLALSNANRRCVWEVITDILKRTRFEIHHIMHSLHVRLTSAGRLYYGTVIRSNLLVALKIWRGQIHLLAVTRLIFPDGILSWSKFLVQDVTTVAGRTYRLTVFQSIIARRFGENLMGMPEKSVETLLDEYVCV